MSLLICDPALIIPPGASESNRPEFWQRLIEWSADSRVRLGPNAFDLVSAVYDDLGWPIFDPPACPSPMKREASRAINKLLARVRIPDINCTGPTPILTPKHQSGTLVEEAIGRDAATLCSYDLTGVATSYAHWLPRALRVTFEPPPPHDLELVDIPGTKTSAENHKLVANYFSERRLTVIGGRSATNIIADLRSMFDLSGARLRWIEAEKNKTMNLDFLGSLRGVYDVLFCITGCIGHPETERVKRHCATHGIALRLLENESDVTTTLASEFARDVNIPENPSVAQ